MKKKPLIITVMKQQIITICYTKYLSFRMDLKTIFPSNPLDLFNLNDSKTARNAPKILKNE